MDELIEHACVVSFGPRRRGKSVLQKKLLKNGLIESHDYVYILAPSNKCNGDYDEFKNEKNVIIYSKPTGELVNHIFEQQVKLKEQERQDPNGPLCPNTLLILDDIIDSHLVQNFGVVDKLAERGRHANISVWILVQKLSAASRSVRLNADYMFMFSPFSISETEQFLEQFVSRSHKKPLHALLRRIFKHRYIFLIIDNTEYDPNLKLKYSNADAFVENDVRQLYLDAFYDSEDGDMF